MARTARSSSTAASSQTAKAAKRSPARRTRAATSPGTRAPARRSEGGALSGLLLAMLLGALGFVASIFWIASMLVMALLVGLMVANRRSDRGVVSEVVAAVVDEIQDISDSTSRA